MPIRNPFARRVEPPLNEQPYEENGTRPKFEKVDTVGSKSTSSALSISSRQSQDPPEYKMSGMCGVGHHASSGVQTFRHLANSRPAVVNDSGVYLPPSPPEKKGIWPRRSNPSGGSTSTRNSEDIEHFSISRESFDSYRRSFDISARSPVVQSENGRQSLDSARMPRLPRSALKDRYFERQPPTAEEGFEDVGLNDEAKQPKKKGFFSKFGDHPESQAIKSPGTTTSRFHIGGRKRGQSGVGEELGTIPRPGTSGSSDVKEVILK